MSRKKDKKAGKGNAGQNRKNSSDFLAKYLQKPGVQTTGSGLAYRFIDQGSGTQRPTDFDNVVVEQRLLLADGTVISDTYREGQAEAFAVEQAIDGLREGLQLMPLGSRMELLVPPELAWGKKGNRSKIGPNALLFFDLRLLEIN
ncbi:FKBP-type peptidyl-prolyl cis-trans isomerase [Agaribacterium haliotis]|uniref:FKBP-type peptidyl-prolyl cis-trans isomerase n=1 Tax=Agaribacterium haliotis TaxID=2013869 RepID=UPI000BB589C3